VTITDGGESTAATNGCQIYTSSDGLTWTSRTTAASSPFGTTACNAVGTDGLGMWVITGGSGKLMTSTDGINWTLRTSGFGATAIYGVAHNGQSGANSLWLAVGGSSKISTSVDGITWTAGTGRASTELVTHNGQSGTDSLFMVASNGATPTKIYTTQNGTAWTDVTDAAINDQYHSMVNNRVTGVGSNIWMLTNSNGTVYTSANNGGIWTARSAGSGSYYRTGYDYSTGKWIVTSAGGLRYSTDLTTWTDGTGATSPRHKVFSHNNLPINFGGLLIAAGSQGGSISYYTAADIATFGTSMLSTSTDDGITWTPRPFPSISGAANDERVKNNLGLAISAASPCAATTLPLNAAATITGPFALTADSTTHSVACPVGYTGLAVRRCTNGTWGSLIGVCVP
jgi:hypothetical protein